uniref:Glutathione S-transferase n=1 Tax=Noctiluca scintillans TaxID=2966 RepID=A0A7S1F8J3_NOCSC|mmetsp:Transcript_43259/g.113817  ORF Transcript_43259/g.113817 Transcript_43259/m.113817 type:complete len:227 (+) Transcript_43259:78-758(+)|eukprot:CAMPEP_0194539234 /NCGR_PEP_ID=MMETSP0253-20130528/79129_1 /TAXON_ID=2966 /ORGANISM="Noctiluca scintillans" /LENGTH=226 /DNA_ID=CAMNT_0039385483 /DNA_START=93 /DNA_END=773 /DNA_ORIENTATION=-
MSAGKNMVLYHCVNGRSFRALWAFHELGIQEYRLVTLPFPPRFTVEGYTKLNVLGTVPFFVDGETRMTESCGIPLYLVEKYGPTTLRVAPNEPDFAAYLNWITHADATLTFPQTVYLRFVLQEPQNKLQKAGEAYAKWFFARLRLLDEVLSDGREFLCAGRFTIADICVTFPLLLGTNLDLTTKFGPYKPQTQAYLDRMRARPAFVAATEEETASEASWQQGESKL